MKKSILLLTLNDYINYQPSVLNLYDFLTPHFDVKIVSFEPESISRNKDQGRNIIYLKNNYFYKHVIQKTDFVLSHLFRIINKIIQFKDYNFIYYTKYLPYVLKSAILKKNLKADIIIAVDLQALEIGQTIFGKVHFFSLEIENHGNPIYKKIDRNLIHSVLIQSKERYDYLFPNLKLPVFYVQNAPVADPNKRYSFDRKDFIWAGTILKRFAVLDCINFFEKYEEFNLVLKGGIENKTLKLIKKKYNYLIKSGRIQIDNRYLPANLFLEFLSHFKIGICFYSWELINTSFNYLSAPSGKLFMYLAAGIPVIACDIPAFKFIKEMKVGVLIKDFEPETILEAVRTIEDDYSEFVIRSYKAATYFSFDKQVAPYIDYLLKGI